MSVLREILTWAQGLPKWQSDAVARLLARPEPSADDFNDLLALLKSDHGIPDSQNRVPKPLTADQIPAQVSVETHIELHAIKNMKHVNAIAENQRLPLNPAGLTVIYGDNGSGKSGYSRVLKRACRARDQREAVYPNATLPVNQTGAAEADFELVINGIAKDVHWRDKTTAPPELSSFAIFDSHCARAYLDTEDDFSYVPYGLDVFEGLAKICNRLKLLIETEIAQSAVDVTVFNFLRGETIVGRTIEKLSARTSPEGVRRLALVTPDEHAQHEELSRSLKENNPKEKAAQLRLRAQRLNGIAGKIDTNTALVDQVAVSKIKDLADSFRTAETAAALAATKFKENGTLLPGTGSDAWRELFEAARKFSVESHPEKIFPDLGADAPCPLCQQPLKGGADRLLRFEAFIQEEAEKNKQDCRNALIKEYKPFEILNLSFNLDDATYSEINLLDEQVAADIRSFESILSTRKKAVLDAIVSQKWGDTMAELISPAKRLRDASTNLINEAITLEQASDEKTRLELQRKFNELDARIKLDSIKDAVLAAISRMKLQDNLRSTLSALRTNTISTKASEVAQKIISQDLEDALNREFKELGVGRLRVKLQSRSGKGKPLHKLKLELPQARSPIEILSEGEQRAIAIGSFLAEICLNGNKVGIVFDDPVSSLDHRRRENVARRLVKEAANRQVIIFTHDIYFLCILAEAAASAGTPILEQSLNRRPEGFGVADADLPFEGKSATKRIGALKERHQIIAKLHREGNESEHRRLTLEAYTNLRKTWERAIEETLLRNVVLRFRKGIETQRLVEVEVEDADYEKVTQGMAKCSNYAHDNADIGGLSVPDPDELLADITNLEDWRNHLESRSKTTKQRRKKK